MAISAVGVGSNLVTKYDKRKKRNKKEGGE